MLNSQLVECSSFESLGLTAHSARRLETLDGRSALAQSVPPDTAASFHQKRRNSPAGCSSIVESPWDRRATYRVSRNGPAPRYRDQKIEAQRKLANVAKQAFCCSRFVEMIALSVEDRVIGFAGRVLYARHDTRARLYRSRLLAQDLRRLGDQLS